MNATISFPDPIIEAVDALAERLGMSRNELFRHAVEKYIESYNHKQDNVREALDMVYCEESPELDNALARMQFASLEHLERD